MAGVTRFRGSQRDRRTDLERFEPMHDKLVTTLAGIERENAGLTRRLEEARARAALLMGNEDGIYFEREPAEEARLAEAEGQMTAAYRRLEELSAQKAMVVRWRDEIEVAQAGVLTRREPPSSGGGDTMRRVARLIGWSLTIFVAYATLSAADLRPSAPWLLADIERLLIFLATAVAFAIGYPRRRLLIFGLGLVVVGGLEFAQNWRPDGQGTLGDAVVKAIGLAIGLLIVKFADRFRLSVRLP